MSEREPDLGDFAASVLDGALASASSADRPTHRRVPKVGKWPRKHQTTRREGRHWTRAEDELLRKSWGEHGARTLRAMFGRTEVSIAGRARRLRLPPASQGLTSVQKASRVLGMSSATLVRFARGCGLSLNPLSACSTMHRSTTRPLRGVVLDQATSLYEQFIRRTTCLRSWCNGSGDHVVHSVALHRLSMSGLLPTVGSGRRLAVPEGVFVEALGTGEGPWCRAWREACATNGAPCTPWLLALVLHDLPEEWAVRREEMAKRAAATAKRRAKRAKVAVEDGEEGDEREEDSLTYREWLKHEWLAWVPQSVMKTARAILDARKEGTA